MHTNPQKQNQPSYSQPLPFFAPIVSSSSKKSGGLRDSPVPTNLDTSATTAAAETNAGSLDIVLGGMFAGKTSRLVALARRHEAQGTRVLTVSHRIDTRYGVTDGQIRTHDGEEVDCVKVDRLMHLRDMVAAQRPAVVLLDEAQFFPDLLIFVRWLLSLRKEVHVFGLDGDFRRQKMGQVLDLVPWCDRVVKLTSRCGACGAEGKGIFTKRITPSVEQVVVGGAETYVPMCRACSMD